MCVRTQSCTHTAHNKVVVNPYVDYNNIIMNFSSQNHQFFVKICLKNLRFSHTAKDGLMACITFVQVIPITFIPAPLVYTSVVDPGISKGSFNH